MTPLHEIEWEAPLIEPYRNPDAEALNRIVRIRRRLGLPTPEPPARRWYRTGEAALFLGVSTKSVLRWTASGFLRCERAGHWAHRYYAVEELLRVQRRLKT